MNFFSRNLVLSVLACGSVAAIVIACGSDDSKFNDGQPPVGTFGDGGFGDGAGNGGGPDLYKDDPPPPWCGPDSGVTLPPIQGTADCPDDKNKPGCGCDKPGDTAPCWTGLRRHRSLGVCKDGVATCKVKNENLNVWGECEGEVLPVPQGKGGEACSCFSAGVWKIANTSPCLRTPDFVSYYAHSTVGDTGAGCSGPPDPVPPAGTAPAGVWSTNTLKVDCAGAYKLCFKIRAGTFETPSANDCVLGTVCTNVDYKEANVEQPLPDLATWAGADPVCAKKWEKDTPSTVSPGYGEMIVLGKTVQCDAVDDGAGSDYVFHRVKYCPRICRPSNPASDGGYQPNSPQCLDCQLKGKGDF